MPESSCTFGEEPEQQDEADMESGKELGDTDDISQEKSEDRYSNEKASDMVYRKAFEKFYGLSFIAGIMIEDDLGSISL